MSVVVRTVGPSYADGPQYRSYGMGVVIFGIETLAEYIEHERESWPGRELVNANDPDYKLVEQVDGNMIEQDKSIIVGWRCPDRSVEIHAVQAREIDRNCVLMGVIDE